ncbi:MAG TPA: porin [Saprospiraceae bacterium]|nr:porin [Saprospiraceae bacterium]
MKNTSIIGLLWLILPALLHAQQDAPAPQVSFSGYVEPYWLYDLGQPADHNRPAFIYSYNRHNEVNINLAMLKASVTHSRIRANLALMGGTYAQANLANEPALLRHLFEANAGVQLSKKHEWWLDMGVFPSHIGFESAIGKDCWTLSRSLLAENSPYYESGIKMGYTSSDNKWFFSLLYLNGWQRIQRVAGNQTPAWGHQITFKPTGRLTLNSSSYIGNEQPDSLRKMRYFHNFYAVIQCNSHLGLTLGFDIGAEQVAKGSGDYHTWIAPIAVAKYQINSSVALAVRAEYYQDKSGVIIATDLPGGFQTWGASGNMDVAITKHLLCRLEYRLLESKEALFTSKGKADKQNQMIALAFAANF